MIKTIFLRAFDVLKKKPFTLWGISLLAIFLNIVGTVLFGIIPGVGLGIGLLLSTSMTMIFLHGYRGEQVKVEGLFECFKDKKVAIRVLAGMAWMNLWILLWSLIPIVGVFFAINRAYAFRLTPYILVTEPEIGITDAIKVSRARTMGYKAKMFGAELLYHAIIIGVQLVLSILGLIPVIGAIFLLASVLVAIIDLLFGSLFLGLVQAAFYEEITNPSIPVAPQAPQA